MVREVPNSANKPSDVNGNAIYASGTAYTRSAKATKAAEPPTAGPFRAATKIFECVAIVWVRYRFRAIVV